MRAGLLNRRVTFQDAIQAQNDMGEVVMSWVDARTVWAAVLPARGSKYFAAQQLQNKASTVIRVRYQPGFRATQRIKHEKEPGIDEFFEIVDIIEVNEDRREIECMCTKFESDGWRNPK